jgi:phosphohistidine phosphatase
MPKQLLLIRHAKSDWNEAGLSDFDRPLNPRGEQNAPEMANRLVSRNIIPQLLVSSPALRAISTARYFARAFGMDTSDIRQEADIYEAMPSKLLQIINHIDDEIEFAALVGHNPALTSLVSDLSHSDLYNIPTCGISLLRFPFDSWKLISAGTGELVFFDYPKNGD